MSAEAVEEPVTCNRAWYSIYSQCDCPPCKVLRARAKKRNACGIVQPRISPQQARDVLAGLLARDWTATAVASATGVTHRYAAELLTMVEEGRTPNVGPAVARAIVEHGPPTRGYVTAIGARRKVRALARIGYSNQAVATKAGLAMNTVAKIRVGDTRRIKPSVAEQIDQAWKALWMIAGPSDESRRIATAHRWPGPLHWDAIDDPASEPDWPANERLRVIEGGAA